MSEFSFGGDSVARSYENILVPLLFRPWADKIIRDHGDWTGRRVLDLAGGTGAVSRRLARAVGDTGQVMVADISSEMLSIARENCEEFADRMVFIECSAQALTCPDNSVDVLVCQQGFQFFPDRAGAACEMHRVLKPGGMVVLSTWLPVSDFHFFGAVCAALESIGEPDISTLMRTPFDRMPGEELTACFTAAGFADVRLERQEMDFVVPGGTDRAAEVAYATPIGPRLRALSPEQQAAFGKALSAECERLAKGEKLGKMATHVIYATKAS